MSKLDKLSIAATAGNVATTLTIPTLQPNTASQQLLYGQIVLSTDGTVADRRVVLQVLDTSDNVIIDFHSGAVVAASQTSQHHEFMQGIYRETSFVGAALQVPISAGLELKQGWKLKVTVTSGVSGDSYSGHLVVKTID